MVSGVTDPEQAPGRAPLFVVVAFAAAILLIVGLAVYALTR